MNKKERYTPAGLTVWIRGLIVSGDIHQFYICKPWTKLRKEVLDEQHHECERCKRAGKYTEATVAHHKQTVRKYPWLALEKNNIEALCDQCHYEEHHGKKTVWTDERW